MYANQEALELTRKAIANAEKLQENNVMSEFFLRRLQLGGLHKTLSRFKDALAAFGKAEEGGPRLWGPSTRSHRYLQFRRGAQLYLKRLGVVGRRGPARAGTRSDH